MDSAEAKIIHDHDYCFTKEKVDDNVKSVEKETVQPAKSPIMSNSLCLSPTYSCDSGIDPFACDPFPQEFGRECDDIFDLFLDEDLFLGLNTAESKEAIGETVKNSDIKTQNMSSDDKFPLKSSEALGSINAFELTTADRNKKNADHARENRKKKKVYVHGLEKEVRELRAEKNVLAGKSFRLEGQLNELQEEVEYLKSLLANESMLSKLLEGVSMTPGISLSTSFCSSRQNAPEDGQQNNTVSTRSRKRGCNSQKATPQDATNKRSRKNGSAGICLHVKENKVSLEFCRVCSKKAEGN